MTDNDVRRIEDKVDNVHLILAELKGSLSPTLEKLTEGQNDLEKKVDEKFKDVGEVLVDHETRLRAQERFRFAVPSISVVALVADVAIGFFLIYHQ